MDKPLPLEVRLSEDEWLTLQKLDMGCSHVMGRLFQRTFNYITPQRSDHFFTTYSDGPWRLKHQSIGNLCGEIPIYCWLTGDQESFRRDLMMLKIAL